MTAMATHFTCEALSSISYLPERAVQAYPKAVCFRKWQAVRFDGKLDYRQRRRMSVVTLAGPSTSSYVFAFVFPLSLLVVTIFAAMRIGDRLDQKFLEELAINQAIREADEEEEEDPNGMIPSKEEPALPPARNRPKREI
ncbi:hypothetical protein Ancab_034684 [Ancistrocladus abbreviatus]